MTRELRKSTTRPTHGLVLANGGTATHEYVVCLSTRARRDRSPYPEKNPLPPKTVDWFVPEVEVVADGECNIEVSLIISYCPIPETKGDVDEVRGYCRLIRLSLIATGRR